MNKAYKLIYTINLILGLCLSFVYLFIINYQIINIFIYVLLCIFYLFSAFKFYKKKINIDKLDYLISNIFILFLLGLFAFNIIYQKNYAAYSFIYYNVFVYIYHLIFLIYNYFI